MHIVIKPIGSTCNNNCSYCYYKNNYKGYISSTLLKVYFQQYINVCQNLNLPLINFTYQGGEPTLLGVNFFKKAIEIQKEIKCNIEMQNSLQTNGLLLNEEWCSFLKKENFTVGISIDGPKNINNSHRGNTFDKVINGINLLKKHNVKFNALICIGLHNINYVKEMYNFLSTITQYIQFIPIVQIKNNKPTGLTVCPEEYGNFLINIFKIWRNQDIGKIFIHDIEHFLSVIHNLPPTLCIYNTFCNNPIVEYNGDVFSCDHFVPDCKIGNIKRKSLNEIVHSKKQVNFGLKKTSASCQSCEFLQFCNGGCPKHRINEINYLCNGYKKFFKYLLDVWNK